MAAFDDEFSKVNKFAYDRTSICETTYIYGQTFSNMRYVKSAHRRGMTDEHLKAI